MKAWDDFERREKKLRDWLQENHPTIFADQKHTEEGTSERTYWHYGYLVCLRDMMRHLSGTDKKEGQ